MEFKPVNLLLQTVGLALIASGGQPLVNFLSGDSSLKSAWPSLVTSLVGFGILLIGFFWKPKADSANRFVQLLTRIGSTPTTYGIILLLFWIYMETLAVQRNFELATLRNDQHSITQVLDRFVLPRQLSDRQINTISSFLQNFPPEEVSFDVAQGDEEAGSYRADIQRALEKGGWHTKAINYVQDPPQIGLSINFTQTMEHAQVQSDWKHPKADLVLMEAFGIAGVRVDSSGGGSGINVTEDLLKITVGHRRRDSYALPCEPK